MHMIKTKTQQNHLNEMKIYIKISAIVEIFTLEGKVMYKEIKYVTKIVEEFSTN